MGARKKALILSGGGGRGAYHVGVIEALVEQGWMEDGRGPDILVGTSIGAINAAALASGLTVAQLKQRWLDMHTEDVHRLSNDLPGVVRPLLRFLLQSVLTSNAHGGSSEIQLPPEERQMTAGSLFARLGALFRAHPFRSLLDNLPWQYTLSHWMDFARINSAAAPALLLAATDLQRGSLRIFSNRAYKHHPQETLTLQHLMASASIPAVYPWTEIEGSKYWDGAVLANTPLGAVIDLAGDEDVEMLVVMMTPWYDSADGNEAGMAPPPRDLVQSLSLTLDWALLASYRTALKLIRSYNALVDAAEKLERAAQQTGDASLRMEHLSLRRIAVPRVIAPQSFMPLEWIIDYEEENHHKLFAQGRADALRVLGAKAAVHE